LGTVRLLVLGATAIVVGLPCLLLARADIASDTSHTPLTITTPASQVAVVDATTLKLRSQVVRIAGVTAPTRETNCRGGSLDCAAAATAAMVDLVRNRTVNCRIEGHDSLGRALGVCDANGLELDAALVSLGYAHATDARSPLAGAEAAARRDKRGLWASADRVSW
jgi:endonuclease YncB( thermonuclease family)